MVCGDMGTDVAMIQLENITISYARHPAVHHVSGCFVQGSLTGIVGPNGAGKSSLLQAIMGLLPINEGRIMRQVVPAQIAYLPQLAEIDRSFPMNVLDTVCLGHWQQFGKFKALETQQREQARAVLAEVGLSGFERRSIQSLSVGQFQRVLFARLILQQGQVILLDEPFAALDTRTTEDLLKVLQRWHQEGRTVVAVLHDLEQVREYFPQTLLLARELIAWGATAEVLTPANLKRAKTMAEYWDESARECVRNSA